MHRTIKWFVIKKLLQNINYRKRRAVNSNHYSEVNLNNNFPNTVYKKYEQLLPVRNYVNFTYYKLLNLYIYIHLHSTKFHFLMYQPS